MGIGYYGILGRSVLVVAMWFLKVRESFPRQVDRESRGPQRERGLEFSRRKKRTNFFSFSTFLRIIYQ